VRLIVDIIEWRRDVKTFGHYDSIINSDIILCVCLYIILNEAKDLVPVYPDETLHCVQYDAREICELNYDAVYSLVCK